MDRGKQRGVRWALLVALLVHGAVFLVWRGAAPVVVASPSPTTPALVPDHPNILAGVTLVAMSDVPQPSALGAAETWADSTHSASPSAVVAPGQALGTRASGTAGQPSRSERSDSSSRSTGYWNHPDVTQTQHASLSRRGKSSPESLERSQNVGSATKQPQAHRAKHGEEQQRAGITASQGQGGVPGESGEEWFALDPRFDTAPTSSTKRQLGVVRPSTAAPLEDQGTVSTENLERGEATQWASAAGLSSRTRTSPFDLGAPSSGGTAGLGAGGTRGKSVASQGGQGSAAQNGSDVARGLALAHATRSNPYFYSMYRRIDKELRFPEALALALEQGEVVLQFRLDSEGRVHGLRVDAKSEFREFDKEAMRAFRAAAPFGRVPKALLAGRSSLPVRAPYYFRNPLIR